MTPPKEIVRVAALGDLHYPKMPQELLQGLLTQATAQADVLLLCGDLTDYGQVDEAVELESALAKLRTPQRIVVLHYSPIRDTVMGEPPEIFAFLGSSRLEEPLNRYAVTAVFHGHAHHGTLEGQTTGGIPVYNVAVPLLHKAFPDRPPFRLVEIPVTPP